MLDRPPVAFCHVTEASLRYADTQFTDDPPETPGSVRYPLLADPKQRRLKRQPGYDANGQHIQRAWQRSGDLFDVVAHSLAEPQHGSMKPTNTAIKVLRTAMKGSSLRPIIKR